MLLRNWQTDNGEIKSFFLSQQASNIYQAKNIYTNTMRVLMKPLSPQPSYFAFCVSTPSRRERKSNQLHVYLHLECTALLCWLFCTHSLHLLLVSQDWKLLAASYAQSRPLSLAQNQNMVDFVPLMDIISHRNLRQYAFPKVHFKLSSSLNFKMKRLDTGKREQGILCPVPPRLLLSWTASYCSWRKSNKWNGGKQAERTQHNLNSSSPSRSPWSVKLFNTAELLVSTLAAEWEFM